MSVVIGGYESGKVVTQGYGKDAATGACMFKAVNRPALFDAADRPVVFRAPDRPATFVAEDPCQEN